MTSVDFDFCINFHDAFSFIKLFSYYKYSPYGLDCKKDSKNVLYCNLLIYIKLCKISTIINDLLPLKTRDGFSGRMLRAAALFLQGIYGFIAYVTFDFRCRIPLSPLLVLEKL